MKLRKSFKKGTKIEKSFSILMPSLASIINIGKNSTFFDILAYTFIAFSMKLFAHAAFSFETWGVSFNGYSMERFYQHHIMNAATPCYGLWLNCYVRGFQCQSVFHQSTFSLNHRKDGLPLKKYAR